jgi:quercetin dioxygenase-like cupin family protein
MEALFDLEPSRRAVFQPDRMGKTTLWQGDELMVGLNSFEPGQRHAPHAHAGVDKLYHVLSGAGRFQVGSESREVGAGGLIVAPAGVPHGVENAGSARLVVLVVMAPPPRS